MVDKLEILGAYLGDDHDLALLKQFAAASTHGEHTGELKTLNGWIDLRESELRSAALKIGARFYAEKPALFCGRLRKHWQIWHGKRRVQKEKSFAV
jgi:hypothetical protein